MHIQELAEAIIIEPRMLEIDEDAWLQRLEDLLDIGKFPFVQKQTRQSTANFLDVSHDIVKEHLLSERIKKEGSAVHCH